MADDAQIFNIRTPDISGTAKARDFKFGERNDYMQRF